MNKARLRKHIKRCMKNLRAKRIKCCTTCPFEEELIREYPELKILFEQNGNTYRAN